MAFYESSGDTRRALMAAGLRPGTRRSGVRHVGVLRQGGAIVAECGHAHDCRDSSSHGLAARECVLLLARCARDKAWADREAERTANAWRQLTGSGGFTVASSTVARARAEAPAKVAEFRDRVTQIAALFAA